MYPSQISISSDHRQTLVIAAVLDDLIGDCGSRTATGLILRRARGEILSLMCTDEQSLARHESLAG
jgi:hypothetical protein